MAKVFQDGIHKMITTNDIDWNAAGTVVKLLLCKSGMNADLNDETDNFLDDVSATLRCGITDRIVLISKTINTATANRIFFDNSAATLDFPAVSTDKVEGYVVFKSSSGEATSPIICYNTLTSNVSSDGGTFTVTFAANGIIQFSM